MQHFGALAVELRGGRTEVWWTMWIERYRVEASRSANGLSAGKVVGNEGSGRGMIDQGTLIAVMRHRKGNYE